MAAATVVGDRQEYTFQAEIKQLLHLLSHSLYQSREIAVRELISNASDALDKMRYVSLTDESQRDAGPLEIVIEGREGRQATGHPRHGHRDDPRRAGGQPGDDRAQRVGRVPQGDVRRARQAKADVSLIGQFGVGFYSAFMIADRVRVRTRSYTEESGWEWESDGTGTLHGHAGRRHAAARHRGDPSSQGRRQGLRRRPGGSRRSSGGIPASFRIRSGWATAARSSTIRSRSGSSPRARSPTSSTPGSTST